MRGNAAYGVGGSRGRAFVRLAGAAGADESVTDSAARIAAWLGVFGVGLGVLGAVPGGCSVWLALPR